MVEIQILMWYKKNIHVKMPKGGQMAKLSEAQKSTLNQSLLLAVSEMNETEVVSLLENGADPDTRNEVGDTLLNIALSSETISPGLIETLVEGGAHLNYVSSDRVTPLMCAVFNVNVPFETVEYLLQSGASVYSRDTYGQTPLLYATGREDVALVDLLFSYGSSVNETDADGCSLIFEAVRQGYENLFSYLVDQGADLTIRDYQGTTLLMAAIEQKQTHMALSLLDFPEIDVLATRVDGLTAFDMVNDLLNEENSDEWKSLSEAISLKASERLSFYEELDKPVSYADEWRSSDDEADDVPTYLVEDNGSSFENDDWDNDLSLEDPEGSFDDGSSPKKEAIGDGFDDLFIDDEEEDEDVDDVEGIDDDTPTYTEIVEKVAAPSLEAEDDLFIDDEEEDEDIDDVEGIDDDTPTYTEIVEKVAAPSLEAEDDLFIDDEEEDEDIEDVEGIDDDTPTYTEIVEKVVAPSLEAEDDLFIDDEEEEEDIEDVEGIDDDTPTFMEVIEKVYVPKNRTNGFSTSMSAEQNLNPYETKHQDTSASFETQKDSGSSSMVQVDPAKMSMPLEADKIQEPASALPLYSDAVYQHATKMLKRYTEYQAEDGQKGVYLSGIYLTNKTCSQARVHIERMLLSQGYMPEQAHEQSVVLLYKLIRANGLYHPKEFVLTADGKKSLAFKVWGCDHRLLLKSLTNEFAPEGDWYHSLSEIEKYVGEKGEGKLTIVA